MLYPHFCVSFQTNLYNMARLLLLICFYIPVTIFSQSTIRWEKLSHNLPSTIQGFSTDEFGNIYACTRRGIYKTDNDGRDWTPSVLFNTEGRVQSFGYGFFDDKNMLILLNERNYGYSANCSDVLQGDVGSSELVFENGLKSPNGFLKQTICKNGPKSGESGPFQSGYEYWGNDLFTKTYSVNCYVAYAPPCGTYSNVVSYNSGKTWESPPFQKDNIYRRIIGVKRQTPIIFEKYSELIFDGNKTLIPIDSNQKFLNIFYQNDTILYCQDKGKYHLTTDLGATWHTDSFKIQNIKDIKKVGKTLIIETGNRENTEGWYVADIDSLLKHKPLYINGLTLPNKLKLLQKVGSIFIGQATDGSILISKDNGNTWQIKRPRNLGVPDISALYGRGDSLLVYSQDFGWFFSKNDTAFQAFTPTEFLNNMNSSEIIISGNKAIYPYWYQDVFTPNNLKNTLNSTAFNLPFKSPRLQSYNLTQCYSADGYAFRQDSLYCFSSYWGFYKTALQGLICQSYVESPTIIYDTICRFERRIFLGDTLNTEGVYSKTLKSVETGCDSFVRLDLKFRKVEESFYREVCPNVPYILFKNDTIFRPYKNKNTFIKSDVNGCDSITYLYINPPRIRTEIREDVCEGHSYMLNGKAIYLSNYPQYFYFDYKTASGCDSLVSYTLYPRSIQNPIVVKKEVNLCHFPNSTYNFYGRSIDREGTYKYVPDCDKDTMIQLKVILRKPPITYVTIKVNAGDTVRGFVLFNDFNFYDVYPNINNACDSEVVTNVVVRPTAVLDLDENALKVYPNPFKEKVTLEINSSLDLMNVEMQDILGRKMDIQQDIMSKNKGQMHLELTLLDVPKGVYFIKLMFKNGYAIRKIVKSD
jgi:Secretion system C-terminal sorting domain